MHQHVLDPWKGDWVYSVLQDGRTMNMGAVASLRNVREAAQVHRVFW